jgi:DNA-binding transcriptional regulator YbjK
VPPPNQRRRASLTDAAIALLATTGVHGVTHRSVERHAGLPAGTASNYFRSREALLVATAERVAELHRAAMSSATGDDPVTLIGDSLHEAATTHRDRYLAVFELRMESLRRPALAAALSTMEQGMVAFTTGHHAERGLPIPAASVPLLLMLYGGSLFTLVTAPPGSVTREQCHELARAMLAAS